MNMVAERGREEGENRSVTEARVRVVQYIQSIGMRFDTAGDTNESAQMHTKQNPRQQAPAGWSHATRTVCVYVLVKADFVSPLFFSPRSTNGSHTKDHQPSEVCVNTPVSPPWTTRGVRGEREFTGRALGAHTAVV